MVGIRSFPFGARPIFRGELLVLGSVLQVVVYFMFIKATAWDEWRWRFTHVITLRSKNASGKQLLSQVLGIHRWPPFVVHRHRRDDVLYGFPHIWVLDSKNRGKTPKWMVYFMENSIFYGWFEVPLFLETPIWAKNRRHMLGTRRVGLIAICT